MKARDVWTLKFPDGFPVRPFDCNPESNDEGFLCYLSKDAAEKACRHQHDLYGLECTPCRLDQLEPYLT